MGTVRAVPVFIKEAKMKNIYFDMDGTLCEFKSVDTLETLYEPGYFLNLKPHENMLEAVKIMAASKDYEVHILSAVLSDSPYALREKNAWLDYYLPQIPAENRVFSECAKSKQEFINHELSEDDCLIDDYTKNLNEWIPPGSGIKFLNGINDTHHSFTGARVDYRMPPQGIVNVIEEYCKIYEPYMAAFNEYVSGDAIVTGDGRIELHVPDEKPVSVNTWAEAKAEMLKIISRQFPAEKKEALIEGVSMAVDYGMDISQADVDLAEIFIKQRAAKHVEHERREM